MTLKYPRRNKMNFLTPSSQYVEVNHHGPSRHSQNIAFQSHKSNISSITTQIWIYVTPLLLFTGTFGSIASICVLLRPSIRKSTPMYFLTLLSFTDIVVLWLGLLRLYLSKVYNFDLRSTTNLSCKLHTFFVYFTLDLSSWLLALIAIERFVFVVFPHTARIQWNRIKGTYAVIIVAVVLTLVNGHYIFTTYLPRQSKGLEDTPIILQNESIAATSDSLINGVTNHNKIPYTENPTAQMDLWLNSSKTITFSNREYNPSYKKPPSSQSCENQPGTEYFQNVIFPWIDFMAFFFLPFCVMVVTHVWIIRHVYLVNARLRKCPQATESSRPKPTPSVPTQTTVECIPAEVKTKDRNPRTDDSSLTFDASKGHKKIKDDKNKTKLSKVAGLSLMLISLLISFAITTCPITIYVIMNLVNTGPNDPTKNDNELQDLLWVIVNMIQYTNNASHFFLFILTSKNFRQELLQMVAEFCLSCKKFRFGCRNHSNLVKPVSIP